MGHVGLSGGAIDERPKNVAGENCSQKFRYSHGINFREQMHGRKVCTNTYAMDYSWAK